jgi:putative endonuclease
MNTKTGIKQTRFYRPLDFIHAEEFKDRTEARKREKYLKSGIGKEWIKKKLSHQ